MTQVGHSGHKAFSVIQVYEWNMNGQKSKNWRLGFRGKQEMCLKFTVIDQCPRVNSPHDEDNEEWIDSFFASGCQGDRTASGNVIHGGISGVARKYPSDSDELSLFHKRVLCCDLQAQDLDLAHGSPHAWLFFVTKTLFQDD